MIGRNAKSGLLAASLAGMILLGACERSEPEPVVETPTPAPGEQRSIFQPEYQVEPAEDPALAPLRTRIAFGDGGAELSEEAQAALATVLASAQVEAGGTIVLRGHSASGGDGAQALEISRRRAEAVRDWLIENDVPEDRIAVIAFGAQNPIRPNALPDGEPNVGGREANRRVDIEVTVAEAEAQAEADGTEPTLAETLSDTIEERQGDSGTANESE